MNDTPTEAARLERLEAELLQIRANLRALLDHVAVRRGFCKGPNCGAALWFVQHADTGALTPYEMSGLNHFVTCPDRERFKRPR